MTLHFAAPNWMWYLFAIWLVMSNISCSLFRSWWMRHTSSIHGSVSPVWLLILFHILGSSVLALWRFRLLGLHILLLTVHLLVWCCLLWQSFLLARISCVFWHLSLSWVSLSFLGQLENSAMGTWPIYKNTPPHTHTHTHTTTTTTTTTTGIQGGGLRIISERWPWQVCTCKARPHIELCTVRYRYRTVKCLQYTVNRLTSLACPWGRGMLYPLLCLSFVLYLSYCWVVCIILF